MYSHTLESSWLHNTVMAKFIRVGNKGINVDAINYYEVGDSMGATLGRGASGGTGNTVSLVIHFGEGERLSILNPKEAAEMLEAIHSAR